MLFCANRIWVACGIYYTVAAMIIKMALDNGLCTIQKAHIKFFTLTVYVAILRFTYTLTRSNILGWH